MINSTNNFFFTETEENYYANKKMKLIFKIVFIFFNSN